MERRYIKKFINLKSESQRANKLNEIYSVKQKTKEELTQDIKNKQRFLPFRREMLRKPGFALTGDALKQYNMARKQERGLPDLSLKKVQTKNLHQVFNDLNQSFQFVKSTLVDTGTNHKPEHKLPLLRSSRIHLTPEKGEKIGFTFENGKPKEDILEVKWGDFKPALAPVSISAPENPIQKVVEQYLRFHKINPDQDQTSPLSDPLNIGAADELNGDDPVQASEINNLLDKLHDGSYDDEVFPSELGSKRQTGLYQSVGDEFQQNLNCSAADAIAYYDFYDLKLLTSPTWTEVFGPNIDQLVPRVFQNFDEKITSEVWNKFCQQMQDIGGSILEIEKAAAHALIWDALAKTLSGQDPVSYNGIDLSELIVISGWTDAMKLHRHYFELVHSSYPPGIMASVEAQIQNDFDNALFNLIQERNNVISEMVEMTTGVDEVKTVFLSSPSRLGYPSKVFAPDSANYGLLVNYRQRWIPESWQVGELVQTIPLAPKEKRRYTKKMRVTKKRSRKEIDNSLSIRKADDSINSRAESQIVQNAQESTSFDATASGGVQVEVFGIGANANGSTTFETSAGSDSSESKRKMRESVAKSAREFRNEHRVEVQIDESSSVEEFSENVISNPNEEITVTYLFYELQRQFSVTETLHKIQSVVLVANEVPHWSEIDWGWIKRHDWILKRCLLDDSFKPALDFVLEGQEAMILKLDALKKRMDDLSSLVASVKSSLEKLEEKESLEEQEMKLFSNTYYSTIGTDDGVIEDVYEWVFGGDEGTQEEEYEARMEGSLDWLDRIGQKLKTKQEELNIQRNALDRAIADYNKGLLEKHSKIRQVDRFIEHLRDNILYYMKAIWSHEPPDQRYLRLFDREVPFTEYPEDDANIMVRVRSSSNTLDDILPGDSYEVILPPPDPERMGDRRLVDIADIENLLGFKGNYMIFPLRVQCYATAWMAQNFVGGLQDDLDGADDQQRGFNLDRLLNNDPQPAAIGQSLQTFAVDPDPQAPMTAHALQDALDYFEMNKGHRLPQEIKVRLNDLLEKGMLSPETAPQRIIVPTDSLYIEALPGKHPILEDFKLRHRMIDAQKAMAEHQGLMLENIRLEARLRNLDLSDPDIDKNIRIEGPDVDLNVET